MTEYAARRELMVDTQVRPSDVTKFPIIHAMLSVPREKFVPEDRREVAYVGECISLGNGRVMLEPRTIAKMLDLADVEPNDLVLDIGCGLGYTAAVLARMAEAVVAVESDPEMAKEAQAALVETGTHNVIVHEGDLGAGAAEHGPYDVIIIEGGVETIPQAIEEQLKEGGRIVAIFMYGQIGAAKIGYKIDGHLSWRFGFNDGAPVLPGFEREEGFKL